MTRILHSALVFAIGVVLASVVYMLIPPSFQKNYQLAFGVVLIFIFIILGLFLLVSQWLDGLPGNTGLLVILGLAFCCRLASLIFIRNEQVSDFAIYQELANALASGKGYVLTGPVGLEDLSRYLGTDKQLPYVTANRAPGAPLWGAFLFTLLGAHTSVFLISNLIMGTVSTWLIYSLLAFDTLWARRASLLWAICPAAIFVVNLFGTEQLFTFFLLLLAVLLDKVDDDSKLKYAFVGILIAWISMIRSTLLVLFGAVLLIILMRNRLKAGVKKIAIVLFFIVLTLSPWMWRNWRVFNEIVPVCTMEGEFLGRHTMPMVPERFRDDRWKERINSWRRMKKETDRSKEGYLIALENWRLMWRGGSVHLANSLWSGVKATFSNEVQMLFWPTVRSYESVQNPGPKKALQPRVMQFWLRIFNAFYFVLVLGAFVGALFLLRGLDVQVQSLMFLVIFFLLFFLSHVMVLGQPRYHFPQLPLFMILAGLAAGKIAKKS